MFIGHGDDHLLPHHAVLAFAHLVRKNAPSARRLGGLLALASSEEGATLVSTLKVLATIYFLPTGGNAPTTKPCVASGRYTPQPPSTSGSCRSTRTRPTPTRGGWSGRRYALGGHWQAYGQVARHSLRQSDA